MMKGYVKRLCSVVVLMACALSVQVAGASEPLKAIIASYLEIHAQLSADKIDGVKSSAAAIAKQAQAMGDKGAAIGTAAAAVGAASDLKTAREAFGPLSDAVVAAARAEGPDTLKELSVKLAFCPMVNRSWVQKEDKVRNPYYGSAMLECGEIKK
jgi:hypothetical protein